MKYCKKPLVIEAFKWTGGPDQIEDPLWMVDAIRRGEAHFTPDGMIIKTLEGDHLASPGDYIIQGIKGEIYPCKPDIFEATYDQVDQDQPDQIPAKILEILEEIMANPNIDKEKDELFKAVAREIEAQYDTHPRAESLLWLLIALTAKQELKDKLNKAVSEFKENNKGE